MSVRRFAARVASHVFEDEAGAGAVLVDPVVGVHDVADRQRQAADAIERINRQLTWNVWMGALTVLVVINLLLLGFVVVRVVIASGGL